MAYGTPDAVAGLCTNLLDGATNFSTSSSPTLARVEKFLSSGCSIIETQLKVWGYAVPPAESTVIYDWLADLNTLYAAAHAEMTRINVTLSPGERTRGQVFEEMFWASLERLGGQDLSAAGFTPSGGGAAGTTGTGGYLYVGGTSVAGKAAVEDKTDRVKPKFRVGMFRFPDSLTPDAADTDSDD